MRPYLLILSSLFALKAFTQEPILEKVWTSDSSLKTPESVLVDMKSKILYVSNIDGVSNEKDGKGSIAKLSLDGKIINPEWVSGLNAPKGMGIFKNKLYVADLTEIVVIDIKKASIIERIPIADAVFLNDLSIDQNGIIYVTDTRTFKVHKIENGNVFLLLEKLQGPNGILATKSGLFILDRGTLLKMSNTGQLSKIADGMDPSTDGIEMVNENDFFVSCWNGVVYYVQGNGNKKTLLDTRNEKINSAYIGYHTTQKMVYVPTFFKNTVVAYRLK